MLTGLKKLYLSLHNIYTPPYSSFAEKDSKLPCCGNISLFYNKNFQFGRRLHKSKSITLSKTVAGWGPLKGRGKTEKTRAAVELWRAKVPFSTTRSLLEGVAGEDRGERIPALPDVQHAHQDAGDH